MAINTYLSTTESKKQTKQEGQRWNQGYREHFDGCQKVEEMWGSSCTGEGIKKYKQIVTE